MDIKYKKYFDLVEQQSLIFDKSENCMAGQTWKYHLLPVINNAIMLAEKYNADKEVVTVAAIFHDYANLLDFNNSDMHHILGAEIADEILRKDGFEKKFIDKVKLCILNHRASVVNEKFSIEEICVADADALTHLDNVVELLMWRGYQRDSVEDANKFVRNKIRKSYAKMSENTQLLCKDRYDKIMEILY